MQYESSIPAYQRANMKGKKGEKSDLKIVSIIFITIIGFMLSRISFELVPGLILAPFGIAYLVATVDNKKNNKSVIASIGVFLGYGSVYQAERNTFIYLAVVVGMFLYFFISAKSSKRINKRVATYLSITVYVVIGVLVGEQGIGVNFTFSLITALAIVPVFFVINQGIGCFKEFKSNHLFSTEELVSMALLLCLAVSGIGSVVLFGIDLRSIVALTIVVLIAYSGGSSVGAIIGITMGIIVGLTSNDMLTVVSFYSISGLIVGVFKETNKLISIAAYFIVFFILNSYVAESSILGIVEVSVSAVILLLTPKKIIGQLFNGINNDEKQKNININQLDGIKNEFIERIDGLKGILSTLSTSLEGLSENDNLLMKNKSVAMIENLADRVCYNCEMNTKCWDRELHNTFNSFGALIGSYQEENLEIPIELERKCVKINTLLKNTEEVVLVHSVNETVRERLVQGRKLISSQIDNISTAMEDIIRDFDESFEECYDLDNILKKMLRKKDIDFIELYTYRDKMGRLKIKIKIDNVGSESYYTKTIIPAISTCIKNPVSIAENGIKINPLNNICTILIEETARYRIDSYAAFEAKNGETYTGDSFSFGKNKNGLYVTAISDGMGSGPEANAESEATIRIIEKFIELGFDENAALNSINSIMGMKFNEDEKFTTLDMNTIDLYTGEISFIKIGGVVSFIKRGKTVDVIESESLPFGIVDSIEVDLKKDDVNNGDIIITVSDGIVDADKTKTGDYTWLKEYLQKATLNPEKLSREILEEAKKRSSNKLTDDMTVVVSKVYSV